MNFPKKAFDEAIASIKNIPFSVAAKQTLKLIDLTSLGEDDTDEKILKLCQQAQTNFGNVAAVCVFSSFVPIAKFALEKTGIKIATVVNFPKGNTTLEKVLMEIEEAITRGANEIDVVFPYTRFLKGDKKTTQEFIKKCKNACGKNIHLKVIMETGAFPDPETIYEASLLIIDAGADFLKTSTGKIEWGATIEAATAILLAIQHREKPVGFKASGGIRQVDQASQYLSLAANIMGSNWISSKTFRFGASSLLKDVLENLL